MTDIEFPLENKEIHVKTFPNPFNSMLTIEVKSTVNENVEFELYNLIGSLILSEHHQINSNSTISLFQNQLRTLNAGIYFLRINSNGNTTTKN
jgi:hypothetical protein